MEMNVNHDQKQEHTESTASRGIVKTVGFIAILFGIGLGVMFIFSMFISQSIPPLGSFIILIAFSVGMIGVGIALFKGKFSLQAQEQQLTKKCSHCNYEGKFTIIKKPAWFNAIEMICIGIMLLFVYGSMTKGNEGLAIFSIIFISIPSILKRLFVSPANYECPSCHTQYTVLPD